MRELCELRQAFIAPGGPAVHGWVSNAHKTRYHTPSFPAHSFFPHDSLGIPLTPLYHGGMPQHLLIDGYNLMHAALPLLGARLGLSLEQKRILFLTALANELNGSARQRTTIIFDAQQTGQFYGTRQQFQSMTILFPNAETDADSVIEELVITSHGPKSLLIVSSDHRIQKAARRRGANFVESHQFAASIFEDAAPVTMSPTTTKPAEKRTSKIPQLKNNEFQDNLQSDLDQALSSLISNKPPETLADSTPKPAVTQTSSIDLDDFTKIDVTDEELNFWLEHLDDKKD
jgi:predicted RNA-binding protein with PIN domain